MFEEEKVINFTLKTEAAAETSPVDEFVNKMKKQKKGKHSKLVMPEGQR
jgi:hypothetical protein